jgi:hypothetical protein
LKKNKVDDHSKLLNAVPFVDQVALILLLNVYSGGNCSGRRFETSQQMAACTVKSHNLPSSASFDSF